MGTVIGTLIAIVIIGLIIWGAASATFSRKYPRKPPPGAVEPGRRDDATEPQ